VVHTPSALETNPVDLPPEIVAAVAAFAPLVSERPWVKAQLLAVGAIRATGNRTLCSVLRVMGLSREAHFTNDHRVLNRDAWSGRAAGQSRLGPISAAIPQDWPIVLAADDTIERRSGRRIQARGGDRDPVRSSRKHGVKGVGPKGVVLTILGPVPGRQRLPARPVLTTLSWPAGAGRRATPKTASDWARPMVLQVRRWLPARASILVTDGGVAAGRVARACQRHRGTMLCRLRLEAAVDRRPGPQPPGKRRPKPRKGPRQRRLAEWAGRGDTPWREGVGDWYRGRRKPMRVFSRTGRWPRRGCDPVAIRSVLARDPAGAQPDAASLGTAARVAPAAILKSVVRRWSLEVTCEEARAHLGLAMQRPWSDRALARTTPVLLGLFALVTLAALHCHKAGRLSRERPAGDAQEEPTSSDCLRLVRGRIWQARMSGMSAGDAEVIAWPRRLFEAVVQGLSTAA
jgi:hypothetical protein